MDYLVVIGFLILGTALGWVACSVFHRYVWSEAQGALDDAKKMREYTRETMKTANEYLSVCNAQKREAAEALIAARKVEADLQEQRLRYAEDETRLLALLEATRKNAADLERMIAEANAWKTAKPGT